MDELIRIASDTAMRAAADWVRLNGVKVTDYEQATQALRSEIKLAMNDALDEAKKASECGMHQIAVCTFRASMMAAGIRAAKQFGEAA